MIDYKYSEDRILKEVTDYVNGTYGGHYSYSKFQATEFIFDAGHGTGFNIGNILKYAQRYGRKGTKEEWRKDLMKVIHYAIMQLHVHDKEQEELIEFTDAITPDFDFTGSGAPIPYSPAGYVKGKPVDLKTAVETTLSVPYVSSKSHK
jgi:hypothetical protein